MAKNFFKTIGISVTIDAYSEIEKIAKSNNQTISAYGKEALFEYSDIKKKNINLDNLLLDLKINADRLEKLEKSDLIISSKIDAVIDTMKALIQLVTK